MAKDTPLAISESETRGEITEIHADIRMILDVSAPNISVPFGALPLH